MASVMVLEHAGLMPEKRDILARFRHHLAELVEKQTGGNRKEFSRKVQLGETFARDVIERNTDPRLSSIVQIATRLGVSVDEMLELPGAKAARAADQGAKIYILGDVGAGMWREVADPQFSEYGREESPFPPDPRYPADAQFDLVVRGNSVNLFARDGERLRCVDLHKAGLDIYDDDLVIVEAKKEGGHLIETTAKRVRKRGPLFELWPDSDDPRWQEPTLIDPRQSREGEETRIIALVLYAYNPARRPRRR